MSLFKIESEKLKKQKKIPFSNEKTIQILVEENLPSLFNLEFVSTELTYGKLRLDTLAFDANSNTFVIIEYKNKADPGLTDQGFAYKTLFRNHSEFFVLEYNKKNNIQLNMKDIDWSKTRTLFISPEFTKYQEAIELDDLPFELWKITKYEKDLISLEPLNLGVTEFKGISEDTHQQTITKPEYTEAQHLVKPSKEMKKIYSELKNKILELGEKVRLDPQKKYIAFKAATNFVDVELQKKAIKSHLNMSFGELSDSNNMSRNVANIGHYGNGDYEVVITKKEQIEPLMELVKQSYQKNK